MVVNHHPHSHVVTPTDEPNRDRPGAAVSQFPEVQERPTDATVPLSDHLGLEMKAMQVLLSPAGSTNSLRLLQVSRGLQLQSLWTLPAAAVS